MTMAERISYMEREAACAQRDMYRRVSLAVTFPQLRMYMLRRAVIARRDMRAAEAEALRLRTEAGA